MRHILFITSLLMAFSSCGQSQNTNDNQIITWQGKAAVGSYAPEGTLEIEKLNVNLENDTIKSLKITIDMKSLSQENKQLTKHLKDKDFFHIKKYPVATFELSKEHIIGQSSKLEGTMTIKNKSQTEVIPATIAINENTLSITFNHTLNRLDYGISYNSPTVFQKLKENAIADAFTLKGTLTLQIN